MPSMLLATFVLLSVSALADEGKRSRDITPDPAGILPFSEALVFGGQESLLVSSGRPGFHRTQNGGERWHRAMDGYVDSTGVEPSGAALCQARSAPSTVYAPGGLSLQGPLIFRTDDLGNSWRAKASLGGVRPLDCAVDPANAEVVYVLAMDASGIGSLFKSTDGSQSFVGVGAGLPPLEGAVFVRTSPTQPGAVYVGNATGDDKDGVYVSNDDGATFARLAASPPLPVLLAAHPTRDRLLFVAGADGGLFRSSDGGATFAQVGPSPIPMTSFGTTAFVAFDPNDAGAVYVAAGIDGLLRSRDFGVTFSRLPGPAADQLGNAGLVDVGVAPAHDGLTHVFVSTSRGPFRSDDGGITFVPIHRGFHGAPVNDLGIDAAGRLMIAALNAAVVFRAQKPGQPRSYDDFTVNLASGPTNGVAIAPSPLDPNVAVAVTLNNGVFTTADGGATWAKATIAPFDLGFSFLARATFAPGSANRVYLITSRRLFGLYRSDDAGHSFNLLFAERLGAIAVDPGNPDILYLATFDPAFSNDHGIFKSVDGGRTVTPLGQPGRFSTLAIDPRNTRTIYASNRAGGVLRSADGGATWAPASSGLPSGEVLAVAVDPQIPARVYAWVKAAGLFASADAGGSWTAADTGEAARRTAIEFGRASLAVDPVTPGRVYIGNSGVVQIDTLREGEDDQDGL